MGNNVTKADLCQYIRSEAFRSKLGTLLDEDIENLFYHANQAFYWINRKENLEILKSKQEII